MTKIERELVSQAVANVAHESNAPPFAKRGRELAARLLYGNRAIDFYLLRDALNYLYGRDEKIV